jgi:hypothetical protein
MAVFWLSGMFRGVYVEGVQDIMGGATDRLDAYFKQQEQ